MLFLIVGLGNPGAQYRRSRHNVGVMAIERLAERNGIAINRQQFFGKSGRGVIAGRGALLLLPQTYMNLSGQSVQAACEFHKLSPEFVVVVHDDVDLELGRIQVKRGGGHGGHKGVESIVLLLGGADFLRVRLGIGRPPQQGDTSDYVLGAFRADEEVAVGRLVERAANAVEVVLETGLNQAMNQFNTWPEENVN
jgi:peptidyl-tRNA hydrolase, PTH1 family